MVSRDSLKTIVFVRNFEILIFSILFGTAVALYPTLAIPLSCFALFGLLISQIDRETISAKGKGRTIIELAHGGGNGVLDSVIRAARVSVTMLFFTTAILAIVPQGNTEPMLDGQPLPALHIPAIWFSVAFLIMMTPWPAIACRRSLSASLFPLILLGINALVVIGFALIFISDAGQLLFLKIREAFAFMDKMLPLAALLLVLSLVAFLLIIAGMALISALNHVRDFLIWRHLQVNAKTRREIARQLAEFKTVRFRLYYIKQLSDKVVAPSGPWPSDFSLADRRDPVITELAKLEEQWLGLA